MSFIKTAFPGLIIVEPQVFEDKRGYFFESYNDEVFAEGGINTRFVQDNQSRSSYGVIRGLHYQLPPFAQTKLLRVLSGTVLDVAVDIRKGSPTYGQAYEMELSAANKKQLLIPKGFAHGFSVLSETAEVFYKCDQFYHQRSEAGILYNDNTLKIDWKIPAGKEVISPKDRIHPRFEDHQNVFVFEGE